MYLDNDYVIQGTRVFGVKGNWPEDARTILVKPVYETDANGQRTKIVDRPGEYGERFCWLDPSGLVHIRSQGLDDDLLSADSVWGAMSRAFLSVGIDRTEIGYFGSHRLGYENAKDVDFVLYGKTAHDTLFRRMNEFKWETGTYNLTEEHAVYQAETHGSRYTRASASLVRCLLNKWSSCMIRKGLCSTVRFVDPDAPSGPLLQRVFEASREDTVTVRGIVSDASGTSRFPRTFTLHVGHGDSYQVIVPLWIYHQCVRDGDLVEVLGMRSENTLIVRDYDHGLRYI